MNASQYDQVVLKGTFIYFALFQIGFRLDCLHLCYYLAKGNKKWKIGETKRT